MAQPALSRLDPPTPRDGELNPDVLAAALGRPLPLCDSPRPACLRSPPGTASRLRGPPRRPLHRRHRRHRLAQLGRARSRRRRQHGARAADDGGREAGHVGLRLYARGDGEAFRGAALRPQGAVAPRRRARLLPRAFTASRPGRGGVARRHDCLQEWRHRGACARRLRKRAVPPTHPARLPRRRHQAARALCGDGPHGDRPPPAAHPSPQRPSVARRAQPRPRPTSQSCARRGCGRRRRKGEKETPRRPAPATTRRTASVCWAAIGSTACWQPLASASRRCSCRARHTTARRACSTLRVFFKCGCKRINSCFVCTCACTCTCVCADLLFANTPYIHLADPFYQRTLQPPRAGIESDSR